MMIVGMDGGREVCIEIGEVAEDLDAEVRVGCHR